MTTPELVKWIPEYMWYKKQIIDFIVFDDEHNARSCLMYQRLGNINFQSWPCLCTLAYIRHLLLTVDSAIQSKGACWNSSFPVPFPGRYIGQVSGLFLCHALAHAFHGGCTAISLLGFWKIVRLLYFNCAVEPWLMIGILLQCTFVFVLFYLDCILFIFQ